MRRTTLLVVLFLLATVGVAIAAVGPGDSGQLTNVQGTVVDTLPDGKLHVRLAAPDEGLVDVVPEHFAGPAPTPPPTLCPTGTGDVRLTSGGSISTGYTSTTAGKTLCLDGGTYTMANLTVAKSITILGVNGASITQTSSTGAMFNVTASQVTIKGLTLTGSNRTGGQSACNGTIGVATGGVGTVTLDGNTMTTFHCGIQVNGSTQFNIRANKVNKTQYAGITVQNGAGAAGYGTIDSNTVTDVHETGGTLGDNAYGIVVSSSASTNASHDITVSNNTVNRVPTWECLDTHSGQRVDFLNNTCIDAGRQPIAVQDNLGPAPIGRVEGNKVDAANRTTVWNAIIHEGANVAGNSVTGNSVIHYPGTGSNGACYWVPNLDSAKYNGNTCTP